MSYGVFRIGGKGQAARLRDQVMMLVLRLRRESVGDTENWSILALLAAIDLLGTAATPTSIARELDLRSSNAAAFIRQAESLHYIERTMDAHDLRKRTLSLTAVGTSVLEAARLRRIRWFGEAIDSLDPDDRETLLEAGRVLERLVRQDCDGKIVQSNRSP